MEGGSGQRSRSDNARSLDRSLIHLVFLRLQNCWDCVIAPPQAKQRLQVLDIGRSHLMLMTLLVDGIVRFGGTLSVLDELGSVFHCLPGTRREQKEK